METPPAEGDLLRNVMQYSLSDWLVSCLNDFGNPFLQYCSPMHTAVRSCSPHGFLIICLSTAS